MSYVLNGFKSTYCQRLESMNEVVLLVPNFKKHTPLGTDAGMNLTRKAGAVFDDDF